MGQASSKKSVKPAKSKSTVQVSMSKSEVQSESRKNSTMDVITTPVARHNNGLAAPPPPHNLVLETRKSLPSAIERPSSNQSLGANNMDLSHTALKRSESLNVTNNKRLSQASSSSSLQHISDRLNGEGSTLSSGSVTFYSGFHEDGAASEASKTLRRSINKRYQSRSNSVRGTKSTTTNDREAKARSFPGLGGKKKPGLRAAGLLSNSCSTLFVDQTVSHPDLDIILRCASTAVHVTFKRVLSDPFLPDFDPIFDEREHPLTSQRISHDYRTRLLTVTEIYDFLRAFFKAAVLKADVAIVTMVYITRLHNAGLVLQPANWKRVLLGAVMLASKVWDDQAVWNADYCTVLPDVSVDSMNQLERKVLELLAYNVSVSLSEYAQHYFDLRVYGHKADVEEGIQLGRLTVRRAKKLEAVNAVQTEPPPIKRVQSQENFILPAPPVIIS
eukprot:comp6878_c1_seq1/m.2627 comp6878_c1_seq1/g.2627  ORF comp6878_c1_seq1/g.2627 comp6878_c1_seq1/m.2627 type:complete len:445 (-) comp6878_c1_seq1:218-1552(-)